MYGLDGKLLFANHSCKEREYLAKGVSYDEAERTAEKEIFKRKLDASQGDWEINGLEVRDPLGPGKEQERTGDKNVNYMGACV